jgi:hypothetical protein
MSPVVARLRSHVPQCCLQCWSFFPTLPSEPSPILSIKFQSVSTAAVAVLRHCLHKESLVTVRGNNGMFRKLDVRNKFIKRNECHRKVMRTLRFTCAISLWLPKNCVKETPHWNQQMERYTSTVLRSLFYSPIRTWQRASPHKTERCGRLADIPASYMGGPGFKSRPRDLTYFRSFPKAL